MTRRVAVALVVLICTAPALAKPKAAVLGLEVKGAAIDQTSTTVAHELTEALRARVRKLGGKYSLADNAEKELIDEKLIKNCDTEAIACMVEIGKGVSADLLIYGKLEKEADQYTITLNILDVKKRVREHVTVFEVPRDSDPERVRALTKKAFTELTDTVDTVEVATETGGTLIVRSNADRAKVYLDDEYQGRLEGGQLTLTGIDEGRYKLALEASGRVRKAHTVAIQVNETTSDTLDLDEDTSQATSSAKTLFYVSAVGAGGLGLFSLYAFVHWRFQLYDDVQSQTHVTMGSKVVTDKDCSGVGYARINKDPGRDVLDNMCSWRDYNIYTGLVAGVFVAAAVVSGYVAFRSSGREPAGRTASRRRRGIDLALVPTLTPQVTGAQVFITW